MKAIWSFGPFSGGQVLRVMGKPVSFNEMNGSFYVFCECDPSWRSLPNTEEASAKVEWHTIKFVADYVDYEGTYLGSIHVKSPDGYFYDWHCIEVE